MNDSDSRNNDDSKAGNNQEDTKPTVSGVQESSKDEGNTGEHRSVFPVLISLLAIFVSTYTLLLVSSKKGTISSGYDISRIEELENDIHKIISKLDDAGNTRGESGVDTNVNTVAKIELNKLLADIGNFSDISDTRDNSLLADLKNSIEDFLTEDSKTEVTSPPKAEEENHDNIHWTYSGSTGPEEWGNLKPEFAMCKDGLSQSPVNITNMNDIDLLEINFSYDETPLNIINNGHTIQANIKGDSFIKIGDKSYKLLQFHFHSPSENQFEGVSFPMEGHFVHVDEEGNLVVIGVMFKEGTVNEGLAPFWSYFPKNEGESIIDNNIFLNPSSILPANKEYFNFDGSLTTPPCTEGVQWFVLKEPVELSADQINKFKSVMHESNNRPIQPINDRMIYM